MLHMHPGMSNPIMSNPITKCGSPKMSNALINLDLLRGLDVQKLNLSKGAASQ